MPIPRKTELQICMATEITAGQRFPNEITKAFSICICWLSFTWQCDIVQPHLVLADHRSEDGNKVGGINTNIRMWYENSKLLGNFNNHVKNSLYPSKLTGNTNQSFNGRVYLLAQLQNHKSIHQQSLTFRTCCGQPWKLKLPRSVITRPGL